MDGKRLVWFFLAILSLGFASCYNPVGYSIYPGTPHLAPTDLGRIELLKREPRREHIRLGEVWITPDRGMSRAYVENALREKAALMGADALVIVIDRYFRDGVVFNYWTGPGAYYERRIIGVAIKYGK